MTTPGQQEQTAFDCPLALVIGCGDMGMAIARSLGMHDPVVLVDINETRLNECITDLRHEGYSAVGQQCDITDAEDVGRLGDLLSRQAGVRVLAHVAALGGTGGCWRRVMDVDLLGVHLIANAVEPFMVKGGAAVFISSAGAYQSPADERINALLREPLAENFFDDLEQAFGKEPDEVESYFMAKKGMNLLAEKLAIAWAKNGVRSISLSPGMIDSTMGRTSGAVIPVKIENGRILEYGPRSEKMSAVPLGRQGTLLEIAAVVDFLASKGAGFITGIDVPVDGGSGALGRARKVSSR